MARKYAEVRSHCDISVYILILHSRVRPPTIYQPLLYLRHMLTPYTETEKLGLQRTKWFENQGRRIPQPTLDSASDDRLFTRRFPPWASQLDLRKVS